MTVNKIIYRSDDITFCADKCDRKTCMRHKSNIMHKDIPHSFANFKNTDYCPLEKEVKKSDTYSGPWVSVKDRLPSMEGCYLTRWEYYESSGYKVASFTKNLKEVDDYIFDDRDRPGWYVYDSEWGFVEEREITHWMPIPKIPKLR